MRHRKRKRCSERVFLIEILRHCEKGLEARMCRSSLDEDGRLVYDANQTTLLVGEISYDDKTKDSRR